MKRLLLLLTCLFELFSLSSQIDLPNGFQVLVNEDGIRSAEGEILDKKPTGLWINFYLNQSIKSKGFWLDGQLDGNWLFYNQESKIEKSIQYQHNLKNGLYIQYDTLGRPVFEGFYVNDTLQGPFRKSVNGIVIETGLYDKGQLDGDILVYDVNEDVIAVKTIEKGKIQLVRPVQKMVNGRIVDAKGDEVASNDDAREILVFDKTYTDRQVLVSQVVRLNGMKNGLELFFNENGTIEFAKQWLKDTLLAEGKMDINGYKDSVWTSFDAQANIVKRCSYKSGYMDGKCIYYFKNGKIEQSGFYTKNELSGVWEWFYPNGVLRLRENYFRGDRDGEQQDFDSLGNLIQNQVFRYKKREGDYFYFIGDHQAKGKLTNGLRANLWVYRYDNGKREFKGRYKDGLPEGKHKYWYKTGRRRCTEKYSKGQLNGRKTVFNINGSIEHQYFYKHGVIKIVDDHFIQTEKEKRDN